MLSTHFNDDLFYNGLGLAVQGLDDDKAYEKNKVKMMRFSTSCSGAKNPIVSNFEKFHITKVRS